MATSRAPILTSASIALVNSFVRDHEVLTDTVPPVWTSTFNDHLNGGYPNPPGEATARPGVRAVAAASRALTAMWDVAIDKYPVGKYLRDARVTTLYEGTSQIQKLLIGRALTGENAFA